MLAVAMMESVFVFRSIEKILKSQGAVWIDQKQQKLKITWPNYNCEKSQIDTIYCNIKFRICFQAHSQNCEKRLLASSYLSVRPSACLFVWNNSAPTGRILMKLDIRAFLETLFH